MKKHYLFEVMNYLLTKLAGAGFTITLMFTFVFFSEGFDLFRFVETISQIELWLVIFGYGFGCSLLIDLLTRKLHDRKLMVKIGLYIVAGYAIFLIFWGVNFISVIAGTVGAICALVFYFGTHLAREYKRFLYVFALIIPIAFLLLTNIDFTHKKNWVEERNDFNYTATFDYFNGKHEIPIYLEEGQRFSYAVNFRWRNEGFGYHVLDEKNKYVGFTEDEGQLSHVVQTSGIYRIVVTANRRTNAGFEVTWEIEE